MIAAPFGMGASAGHNAACIAIGFHYAAKIISTCINCDSQTITCHMIVVVHTFIFSEPNVELLSWCRGILDRLDKLARDRLLAIGNNN